MKVRAGVGGVRAHVLVLLAMPNVEGCDSSVPPTSALEDFRARIVAAPEPEVLVGDGDTF